MENSADTSKCSRGRKKMFALIFWPHEKSTDIIPLSYITKKSDQVPGSKIKLKWKPADGSAMILHDAVVLKVHHNKQSLLETNVSEQGKILPTSQKALTKSVLLEKKQMSLEKKMDDVRSARAALERQKSLLNSQPLCVKPSSSATVSLVASSSAAMVNLSEGEQSEPDGSDAEESDAEPSATDVIAPSMQAMMPEVTLENITFMRNMLHVMETIYKRQNERASDKHFTLDLAAYKKSGDNMAPFHSKPSNLCFLPKDIKEGFEANAHEVNVDTQAQEKDWRALVRQVLIHLYRSKLKDLCAKGRKNSRPGIDPQIYLDLFLYAKEYSGVDINDKDYGRFINVLCGNKRPAEQRTSRPSKKSREEKEKITGGTPPPLPVLQGGEPVVNTQSEQTLQSNIVLNVDDAPMHGRVVPTYVPSDQRDKSAMTVSASSRFQGAIWSPAFEIL